MPEGDHIRPSTGYGGVFSVERQKRYGLTNEKPPLIFASRYLTKTLPFGLHSEWNEKILNSIIKDSPNELVLMCDRDKAMARERDITVFKMPDTSFQDLTDVSRQSISTEGVTFTNTEIVLKAKNVNDLMSAGLQVLSFKESYKELFHSGILAKIDDAKDDKSFFALMSQFIKQGVLTWENKALGLCPDSVLAKNLDEPIEPFKPTLKRIRPTL